MIQIEGTVGGIVVHSRVNEMHFIDLIMASLGHVGGMF